MMNFVNYIKRTVKSLHHNCTCGPVVGGVGRVLIGVRREMQRSPCRTGRKSSQIGLWQALLIRSKRASLPQRLDAGASRLECSRRCGAVHLWARITRFDRPWKPTSWPSDAPQEPQDV